MPFINELDYLLTIVAYFLTNTQINRSLYGLQNEVEYYFNKIVKLY